MESIDGAGEFRDCSVDNNFDACERSMKQVVLVFKHLGKAWKVTLQCKEGFTCLFMSPSVSY